MKSETFFDQTGYRSGRDRQARGGYRLCAVLGVVQADVFDLDDGHAPERPRVRRIKAPDRQHPAYAALMRSSTVLDVVADLIGPNIRFDHAKLNCKPAGGGAIEWRQDWAFYPQTNDDMLAVSVMLDDCEADNGPLHVIPRWRLNVQTSPPGPPSILESRGPVEGNPPRGEFEAPAPVRKRVRIPFQSPSHTEGCIPITAGPHDAACTT